MQGKTPLHKATWSREISVMQELLAARAAVNTADIRVSASVMFCWHSRCHSGHNTRFCQAVRHDSVVADCIIAWPLALLCNTVHHRSL